MVSFNTTRFIPSALALLSVGCFVAPSQALEISEVVVTGYDFAQGRAESYCKNLSMTQQEAVDYFDKARPIDSSKAHHEVDYFSCWFEGTLRVDQTSCTWQLDIGGLATVDCGDVGHELYCSECTESLLNKVP